MSAEVKFGALSSPVNIVVAVDSAGGFGYQGNIPWKDEPFQKADWKRFKELTTDGCVVMGRKTYEEIVRIQIARGKVIGDDLLPGRVCIVLSSTLPKDTKGIVIQPSLRAAREFWFDTNSKFPINVIGGEKLFIEALSIADNVMMTIIKKAYQCDRFFPIKYLDKHFKITNGKELDDLYFVTYTRNPEMRYG